MSKAKLNAEERELLDAYESGEFISAPSLQRSTQVHLRRSQGYHCRQGRADSVRQRAAEVVED